MIGHPALGDALVDHLFHLVEIEADALFELLVVEVLASHARSFRPRMNSPRPPASSRGNFLKPVQSSKAQDKSLPWFQSIQDVSSPPRLAAVPGERQHQGLGPAGVDAVGVAADVEAVHENRLLSPWQRDGLPGERSPGLNAGFGSTSLPA